VAYKRSSRANATRRTVVQYEGSECAVSYRPSVLTPAFLGRLRDVDNITGVVEVITACVAEWDVEDEVAFVNEETGETDMRTVRLQPTLEVVQELEVPFLIAVSVAIANDFQPSDPNSETRSSSF
jgi:hypothetical protein